MNMQVQAFYTKKRSTLIMGSNAYLIQPRVIFKKNISLTREDCVFKMA